MATWVDYKEIKHRVRILDVLTHYGLAEKLRRRGDTLVGPCPIHKGTNATQFHVSLAKNNFNCFGDCHGGGNVIDLVAKIERVEIRQAALKLREWFGVGEENGSRKLSAKSDATPAEDKTTKELVKEKKDAAPGKKLAEGERCPTASSPVKENTDEPANPPLSFALKNLDPNHSYLAARGFTKETVSEFGLGYCKKGLMVGRIAIPIHNQRGELVAYAGRWPGDPPDGEGKYKLPTGFHKSLVVFNLHRAQPLAASAGLILVEGFFDCMRLWQAGIHHVVALMGSSLSPEQESLIVEAVGSTGKVALMFDEDEAGWACREDVLLRLTSQVYVRVIGLGREGAQPDTFTAEDLQALNLL